MAAMYSAAPPPQQQRRSSNSSSAGALSPGGGPQCSFAACPPSGSAASPGDTGSGDAAGGCGGVAGGQASPQPVKQYRSKSAGARVEQRAPSPLGGSLSPSGRARKAKAKARERESAAERAAAAAVATAAGVQPPPSASRKPRKMSRKQAEALNALQRDLAEMSSEGRSLAERGAIVIQRRWRNVRQHVFLIESLRRLYSQPDLEKARKHAETFLPKDRFGNPHPLSTPFKSFHSMGCGVALYMYVTHWWMRLFLAFSLITSGITFLHVEGSGLAPLDRNYFTFHSLGNWGPFHNKTAAALAASAAALAAAAADNTTNEEVYVAAYLAAHPPAGSAELPASFGAVEILLALILTWFIFWQSNKVANYSRRITHQETTAANYTVMVGRMPKDTRATPALFEFFSRWGEVVHMGVSYNHRDLILAARTRAQAREALHAAHVQWYLAKVEGYPQRKRDRSSRAVATAKHRLWETGKAVQTISALEPICTGFLFVTFDTVDAAQACIAGAAAEKKYFRGAGPLSVVMAPEPEDIIWENLQYSREERTSRLVLSSILILALTIINTTLIAGSSVFQSQTMAAYGRGGPEAPALLTVMGVFVLCTLLLVACYVSVIMLVPVLAHKLERWHQFANREMAILVKLTIFQVLNTIAPATVFVFLNDWRVAGNWYATGGALVLNALIGDLFLVNFGIDLMRPGVMIFRKVRGAHRAANRHHLCTCLSSSS